jgi:peptidoglycan/xylan/chitin deacetylase (PgdA/CDA1 family)
MREADEMSPRLARGVFTISIDTELAWGGFDRPDRAERWALEEKTRAVIGQLLDLFTRYQISATWAIVGHLFLDRCQNDGSVVHPEIPRPRYSWHPRDWYEFDPATTADRHPLWYGPDIVRQILDARPEQEIASHSFAHVIFGDPGCSAAAAAADLEACGRAARPWGVELRSFVYPRNRVGHLHLLPEHGFRCFRGQDPAWFARWPSMLRRAAHFADDLLALPPPTVQPTRVGGLWNIPGSVMMQGMDGLRAWIPSRCRTRRCLSGLRRAVERHEVFHLWFHPSNFSVHFDRMVQALTPVLEAAAECRDRGGLEILTMGQLAVRLDSRQMSQLV